MQKRLMLRSKACFGIIVYHRETPILMCDAENICSEGMFIKTIYGANIPEHDLKIGFEYGANGQSEIYKLPVTVVHREKNGVGFSFSRIVNEPEIFAHTLLGYISRTYDASNYTYDQKTY